MEKHLINTTQNNSYMQWLQHTYEYVCCKTSQLRRKDNRREWTSNRARTEFKPHELQNSLRSFVFHHLTCASHECAADCNCLRSAPQCRHLCSVMVYSVLSGIAGCTSSPAWGEWCNCPSLVVYVKYVFVSLYASITVQEERSHVKKDQQQSSKSGPTGHISAWQWEMKDCGL